MASGREGSVFRLGDVKPPQNGGGGGVRSCHVQGAAAPTLGTSIGGDEGGCGCSHGTRGSLLGVAPPKREGAWESGTVLERCGSWSWGAAPPWGKTAGYLHVGGVS